MKIVHFIKTLPYDVTDNGKLSVYDGYVMSTKMLSNPGIKHASYVPRTHAGGIEVFTSTSRRTQETAEILFASDYRRTGLLNEVGFDLSALINKREFTQGYSAAVRDRFCRYFINDNLCEKHTRLCQRIERVLEILQKNESKEIYCVSHSFYMKIIEAYIDTDRSLFIHPQLIRNYILINEPTYQYGKGFTICLQEDGMSIYINNGV